MDRAWSGRCRTGVGKECLRSVAGCELGFGKWKRVSLGGGSTGVKVSVGRQRASLERMSLAWLEPEASDTEKWELQVAGRRGHPEVGGALPGEGLPGHIIRTSPVPARGCLCRRAGCLLWGGGAGTGLWQSGVDREV